MDTVDCILWIPYYEAHTMNWLALENDLLHLCSACIHFPSARDDYHGT